MKNLEKLLQSSKKLEERQTARKAKEVDEVHIFNLHKECYKKCELDMLLEIDHAYTKRQVQKLEEPVTAERECIESKVGKLLETEEFEKYGQDTQENAPNNDFEVIAEIQEFHLGKQPYALKQLPAGSPNTFTQDLTELTEAQLQRELKQNEAALNKNQEDSQEEEKTPGNVFFFRPVKTRTR